MTIRWLYLTLVLHLVGVLEKWALLETDDQITNLNQNKLVSKSKLLKFRLVLVIALLLTISMNYIFVEMVLKDNLELVNVITYLTLLKSKMMLSM